MNEKLDVPRKELNVLAILVYCVPRLHKEYKVFYDAKMQYCKAVSIG